MCAKLVFYYQNLNIWTVTHWDEMEMSTGTMSCLTRFYFKHWLTIKCVCYMRSILYEQFVWPKVLFLADQSTSSYSN